MKNSNYDPQEPREINFTELEEQTFLNTDEIKSFTHNAQMQIADISRQPANTLSYDQSKLARRVTNTGTRIAIELLLSDKSVLFDGNDAETADYTNAVAASLKSAEAIFMVLHGGREARLKLAADQALSFNASADTPFYAGNQEALAAYLEQVAVAANVIGLTKTEIPTLRTGFEDYSVCVLGLISAISERKGGVFVTEKVAPHIRILASQLKAGASPTSNV